MKTIYKVVIRRWKTDANMCKVSVYRYGDMFGNMYNVSVATARRMEQAVLNHNDKYARKIDLIR